VRTILKFRFQKELFEEGRSIDNALLDSASLELEIVFARHLHWTDEFETVGEFFM
jgi:hypothetical protein